MSASRTSTHPAFVVGAAVRVSSFGDPADGLVGFITDVGRGIARVEFYRHDTHPRWFTVAALVDERLDQTEEIARKASGLLAAGIQFELTFKGLEQLERTSCRLTPTR
jgi:hypothetical protein